MSQRTRSSKKKANKAPESSDQTKDQSPPEKINSPPTTSNCGHPPEEKMISMQECEQHTNKRYNARPAAVVLEIIPDSLKQILEIQYHMAGALEKIQEKLGLLEKACSDSQVSIAEEVKQLKNSIEKFHITQATSTLETENRPTDSNFHPSTPVSCATCSHEAVDQSLSKEVAEILMQEKKRNNTKDECRKIKSAISVEWDKTLKIRDKHYRNFIKNERKSTLYEKWATSSPNYIPYKFRPKRIPGETEDFTTAKIQEARLRYSNERNLLKKYAETHRERYQTEDEKITKIIKTLVGNDDQLRMMTEQWIKETKQGETRANQLWSRNEAFLNRKKHEDEQNNEIALSDITWKEKLRSYGKKRRNETVYQQPNWEQTNFYQYPEAPVHQLYAHPLSYYPTSTARVT